MLFYLLFVAVIFIISAIFRLASALGLSVPLAYALIAPTLFYDWFHSHQALAEGIGWALISLTQLSSGFSHSCVKSGKFPKDAEGRKLPTPCFSTELSRLRQMDEVYPR